MSAGEIILFFFVNRLIQPSTVIQRTKRMAAGGAGEMEEEESAEDLSTVVKDWMKQNYIKVNISAIDIITIVTITIIIVVVIGLNGII